MKRCIMLPALALAVLLLTLAMAPVPQAAAQTCVQPPSGLIGWWPGDGDPRDLARQNSGTVVGGVSYLPGKVGQAFHFDGVMSSVNIPNTDGYLALGAQLTIDFWVRADEDNPIDEFVGKLCDGVHGCAQGLVTTDYYCMEIENSVSNIHLAGGTDSGGNQTSNSSDPPLLVPPGEWHLIAGVYDGSALKYFVDGTLKQQVLLSGTIRPPSETGFLSIGSELGRDAFPFEAHSRWFKGLIDEVELYNRALTQEEIQAIYNAGSAGKCKVITVQIDIKPDSATNSINLSSAGVVPVAILSSSTFDAATVNPETVTLAGARVKMVGKSARYLCHAEDVNADGRLDLVCQVNTAQFMIEPGDSVAVLEATTSDGQAIRGEDSIRIVPN